MGGDGQFNKPQSWRKRLKGVLVWYGLRVPQRTLPQDTTFRPVPWLTDGAVKFLDNCLNERGGASRGLEFGSGASTLWAAPRVAELVSFEDDPAWGAEVQRRLDAAAYTHVTYHRTARPWPYLSRFPDHYFDWVLVDHVPRLGVKHVRSAKRLVKPGGILMVDNMEREDGPYRGIPNLLSDWTRTDFEQIGPDQLGWIAPMDRWITSIWVRPR